MTAAVSQLETASARSRPRCLIVEDEVLIALSIEGNLEDLGYEAEGPFAAGAAARGRPFSQTLEAHSIKRGSAIYMGCPHARHAFGLGVR
jgi:hypothetical protein